MRIGQPVVVFGAMALLAATPLVGQTFTKTVGLAPPPACATSSTLNAVQGQTVYYCYAFQNTANATYTYSLYDNRLGTIAANATAAPFSTSYQFASAVANFTGGSTIVNNATWIVAGFGTSSAIASVVQAFAAVPMLGGIGLLALGLGLVGAGVVLLRRPG